MNRQAAIEPLDTCREVASGHGQFRLVRSGEENGPIRIGSEQVFNRARIRSSLSSGWRAMPETVTCHDFRRHLRTHIFLAALLKTPAGNCAARVRNLSQTGALIEASILPEAGTPVRLVRGSLEAVGKTVWRSGSRCGIAFSSHVSVEAWLADSNARQARVDALVGEIRGGRAIEERPAVEASCSAEPNRAFEVLAELAMTLGRRIASDPVAITKFSSELQGFDILAQALEAMHSQDPGSSRRLADTLSACAELLLRLNAAAAQVPEPALVRNGSVPGRFRKQLVNRPGQA